MEKRNDFSCTLLRLERLQQNKGQKEVCYGICVPSYLSKIEHNQVSPDPEILKQLFQRLDIQYYYDEAFLQRNLTLIELYYEQLLYSYDRIAYKELLNNDGKLSYSPLALDWLIIKALENDADAFLHLSKCQNSMNDRQLAYYYLSHPLKRDKVDQIMPLYLKSYYILNNSLSLLALMHAYFIAGQYDKIHENLNKCVSLALEEGNTRHLASCYDLAGTAYACMNAEELMISYYKRAIHLLQNTAWKDSLNGIYYNIGATYITSKKYDLALKYLNMDQIKDSFLLNQKKALALIRSFQINEAEEYLDLMKTMIEDKKQKNANVEIEQMMYHEAIFECQENFLDSPDYLKLLEALTERLKKDHHRGYADFYQDVLKDAYCRQRKYKKALEIFNTVS